MPITATSTCHRYASTVLTMGMHTDDADNDNNVDGEENNYAEGNNDDTRIPSPSTRTAVRTTGPCALRCVRSIDVPIRGADWSSCCIRINVDDALLYCIVSYFILLYSRSSPELVVCLVYCFHILEVSGSTLIVYVGFFVSIEAPNSRTNVPSGLDSQTLSLMAS